MANRVGAAALSRAEQLDFLEPSVDNIARESLSINLPKPDFFTRRNVPVPSPVFATYWQFAKIRQDRFFARFLNPENILSLNDPILNRYRFTNIYRASDRVSQYLIRKVLYNKNWSPDDLVFRLLVFKFFNKIETWEAIERAVGPISWKNYNFELYDNCLSHIRSLGKTIYSAAYIMASGETVFGYKQKHKNHLKVIELMLADQIADRLTETPSLESAYRLLRQYPCIGPFIGYQFAVDLNYSSLLDFSENQFVEPGPGALDGIAKCFTSLGDYTPSDIIRYMVEIQDEAFREYAPGFRDLWGRPLHLIDCQNLFCEVDKYARIAHPEIEGRSKRTRIKQLFKPSTRPVPTPWYPPKWALNDKISADSRLAL